MAQSSGTPPGKRTKSGMSDLFRPSSNDNRRRASRAEVAVEASLRKPSEKPFKVRIRDISQTGCRAETVTRTREGDRVWLTIPGFAAIEGVIRWSDHKGFGCEWVSPLHASVYDHVRARFPGMFS